MSTRESIPATYDSRRTGNRYYVTTRLGSRTIAFEQRIPDPFVRQTVHIAWRDLLRGLLRLHLEVTVLVGADRDVVEDVLELDENYLGTYCTRRDAFNASVAKAIGQM